MMVAAGVLIAIYILIFSDIIHRTSAAVIGAVAMITTGMLMGFYSQEEALRSIDANTILLLFGMMVVVEILRPTGGFGYVAIRIAKMAGGSPRLLLVYLGLAVSVISMFLDNVTTIVIFAPLTLLITRILDLNPMPYLVAEAMLSNIGGTATLVGDPPNIMIGSATDIGFNEFLFHLGPPIAVVWLFSTALVLILFRRELVSVDGGKLVDLDERRAIKDARGLKRGLFGLSVIILLFFTHRSFHVYPAFAVFIGLALMLALTRPKPETLLREVHWALLVFFAGLFVIGGGVEASGLLDLLGEE
ncbi:MAG: citrate transporter, partial [Gammaproteobacteria bacterium]|nr:citrate transporter [Gammaproteobacteria bacterium]